MFKDENEMSKTLEHSGAIQARIEGFTMEQLLIRDELTHDHGLSFADATAVVRGEKWLEDFGIKVAVGTAI